MVFDQYAYYYDLLYKDKNYKREADYIDKLIKKYHSQAKTILDLGCGTGKHAALLADKGYTNVHGVDISENMLNEARKRAENKLNLSFTQGDIQKFNFDEKYDVVTSLFHVMSYQTTDEALSKVFSSVKEHLNDKGIFIFDCWYGPAVLLEKPEIRVKRLEDENALITRIAEPIMKENENIVEVSYDVFVNDKINNSLVELKEKHIMRYFFKNEIINLAGNLNYKFIDAFEFMTDKSLDKSTWGSCFVLGKN